MEKEKLKEMSRIDDGAYLARLKAQADATFYTAEKETEANRVSDGGVHCINNRTGIL